MRLPESESEHKPNQPIYNVTVSVYKSKTYCQRDQHNKNIVYVLTMTLKRRRSLAARIAYLERNESAFRAMLHLRLATRRNSIVK